MKKILAIIFALSLFAGCDKDNEGVDEKKIELSNKSEQNQTAFADDEAMNGFTFTAKKNWTATVTEGTVLRASSASWLRLLLNGVEKYNGSAGTFTFIIEIDTNYSGVTRTATIDIASGNDKISVNITQQGINQDGTVPKPAVNVTGITLDKNDLLLTQGDVAYLQSDVQPGNADNRGVTWTSSNPAIVNVIPIDDISSKVAAVGVGEAAITVTTDDGSFTAFCTITVSELNIPVTGVTLNKANLTLAPSAKDTLIATVLPENASDKTATWSSSNEGVATVSQTGEVLSVSVGICSITAEADGKTAVCVVSVLAPNSDPGVIINGVKWATRNLDTPGTFTAAPESYGNPYKFGGKWLSELPGYEPPPGGQFKFDELQPWAREDDPSPTGWRVPNILKINNLLNTSKVSNEWVMINGVNGRKFTNIETGNSIFLPATFSSGDKGFYWSSEPGPANRIGCIEFSASVAKISLLWISDLPIRCVAE